MRHQDVHSRAERRKLHEQAAAALSRIRRYSKELPAAAKRDGDTIPFELNPQVASAPLAAAWLGHATVLIRIGGKWVLTDPVMSHRIGIPVGPVTLGLSRLLPPIDLQHLPPIDLILVSHAHFDHLDKPTLRRLVRPDTRVVTAENTKRLIPRGFAQVDELPWDREIEVAGLRIHALRPRHWGARVTLDKHRGYNSYFIQAANTRVLYAGDTALTDAFATLKRHGPDLSIFGIGAYDPWIHAHASPEQAWQMHTESGARYLLPMHHSTFKLSDEPRHEPMQRLLAAAGEQAHSIVGTELGRLWLPT